MRLLLITISIFILDTAVTTSGQTQSPTEANSVPGNVQIQLFRSELNDPNKKRDAMHALLALNDEQAVSEAIYDYFHSPVGGYDLDIYGRELVISKLMSSVLGISNEPLIFGSGDAPSGLGLRDQATIATLKTISHVDSFPVETRDWARNLAEKATFPTTPKDEAIARQVLLENGFTPRGHLPKHPTYEMAVRMLREWWQHNKDAVLSKHCEQATWLPDKIPDAGPADFPRMPIPYPHTGPTTNVPVEQSSATVLPTSVPESGSSAWFYLLAIIAGGGLAGLGVWHFRKGPRT